MTQCLKLSFYLYLILLGTTSIFAQSTFVASRGMPVSVFLTGMASSNPSSSAAKLTDGIVAASNFFELLPGNEGSRILIMRNDTVALSRLQIRTVFITGRDYRLRGYEFRTSLDSVQWTLVASDSSVDTTVIDEMFPTQEARFFEITITRMDTPGAAAFSTVLGEISLWADIDRPMVTAVSVAASLPESPEYRTIIWTSTLWDSSKTVSILAGPSTSALGVIAQAIPNSGAHSWRTSVIPDGPMYLQVIPDTVKRYHGEAIVTISNFTSLAANILIPVTYNYRTLWPPLYSAALNDTIRFSWSFLPRFNVYDGQEIRFSSDSGVTWTTVLGITDTSLRSIFIAAGQLPSGGEKCFLEIAVLMGNTRMVSFRHKLPFQVAAQPLIGQNRWSRGSVRGGDTFPSDGIPNRRGLVGYLSPARQWRIIGGPRWLLDGSGGDVGTWNMPFPQTGSVAAADANLDGIFDIVPNAFTQLPNSELVQLVLPDTSSPQFSYYASPTTRGDYQLVDIDGDDSLEIAYTTQSGATIYRSNGRFFRTYSWSNTNGSDARFFDVAGGPSPEMIVVNGSTITAFDSVGQALPNFPATFATTFTGPPLPFDADGDGKHEILVCGQNQIYCVTGTGTVAPGFPVSIQGSLSVGPSIGDIDADGDLDFVVVRSRYPAVFEVYCYDAHGSLLNGWPRSYPLLKSVVRADPFTGDTIKVDLSASPAQPLIASIDGGQECEIIISTAAGLLYVFRANGADYPGSPFFLGTHTQEAGILGDFDADGAIEYIYPIYQEYPARYSIANLEFGPGSYNPSAIPWPMYLADATKSGLSSSAFVVKVEDDVKEGIPKEFSLSQNYPNPFNPSTTVRYALPKSTHTTIRVINMLGQIVTTLVDELREAGTHTARFDGSRFPSGVYLIQVFAGSDHATRKMILVK